MCNHVFEIIEECRFEDLNIRERYWQDYYDVLSPKGLNCVLTNTNELPKVFSHTTKNKISQSKSINILCIETGIIYLNTRYASKEMNISPTLINNSCNNGTKAKGYTFKKLK